MTPPVVIPKLRFETSELEQRLCKTLTAMQVGGIGLSRLPKPFVSRTVAKMFSGRFTQNGSQKLSCIIFNF